MSHQSTNPEAFQSSPVMHESPDRIELELLALKNAALRATAEGDVGFYAAYLADHAIGVTPFGVFDKQKILQGMKDGKSFRSKSIADEHALALGADAGLVTYRATFEAADGQDTEVFVSTLYRRFDDGWKGVFYQQTLLPRRQDAGIPRG
jgi:hypothetical protein